MPESFAAFAVSIVTSLREGSETVVPGFPLSAGACAAVEAGLVAFEPVLLMPTKIFVASMTVPVCA